LIAADGGDPMLDIDGGGAIIGTAPACIPRVRGLTHHDE